ncbi:MAG: hypothetical protein R3345_14005 [Fulvivirga sp.]|nr:hypothetical protein [Fulvivirga sp.]
MNELKELNEVEYVEIFGGRPDNDTSLFYDIGWFIGAGIRKVEQLFK